MTLLQITNGTISTLPIVLEIKFPIPHDAAAIIIKIKPIREVLLSKWNPTRTIPEKDINAPISCHFVGFSPKNIMANKMVKKACICNNKAANPAGIPSFMLINNSENCPTNINDAYRVIFLRGNFGFLTKNIAGRLANKNLKKQSQSGVSCCNAILIVTKLNPQIIITNSAKKIWGSDIEYTYIIKPRSA